MLSVDVAGTAADIAAAADAILADGGTVVRVQSAPSADGVTQAARIDYLPGRAPAE
jgi:hypothetical protein